MRVMFISSPTDSILKRVVGTTGPPLSLAYLASMVREEHDVRILDAIATGLSFENVEREIRAFDPDVVGITSTTSMIPDACRVGRIAKHVNENIKVIIGGPHVTFLPAHTMKECPAVDFIVRGEGEYTFRELIDAIGSGRGPEGIRGLTYRKNGRAVNNPPRGLIKNIDEIPVPSYDLLPMDSYVADGIKFGTVVTSRGCPFNCIFCSSSLQFGKRWRGHSVERVIQELSILRNEYRRRAIEFLDDTFTLAKGRAVKITQEIRKQGLDISWTASSRVDTFSPDIARAMKRSGAHTVYFGIESGTQKTLNFIGKGITPEQSRISVRHAKKAGLHALGSFIIGFPQETREEVHQTLKFSRKVGVDFAQFTVATPYPGTRLWYYALSKRLFTTLNWCRYTTLTPVMRLEHFTRSGISNLLRYAYIRFYLRPVMIFRDLSEYGGFITKRASLSVLRSFAQHRTCQYINEVV